MLFFSFFFLLWIPSLLFFAQLLIQGCHFFCCHLFLFFSLVFRCLAHLVISALQLSISGFFSNVTIIFYLLACSLLVCLFCMIFTCISCSCLSSMPDLWFVCSMLVFCYLLSFFWGLLQIYGP